MFFTEISSVHILKPCACTPSSWYRLMFKEQRGGRAAGAEDHPVNIANNPPNVLFIFQAPRMFHKAIGRPLRRLHAFISSFQQQIGMKRSLMVIDEKIIA